MSLTNKEASGIPLPAPVAEQAPAAIKSSEKAPRSAEKPAVNAERAPISPTAPTTIPLPVPPLVSMAPPNDVSVTTQSSSLVASDDGDLIEKEWVDKAKQIVEHNREDPYKQSEELTVFKADYMKKRYGKTIKVSQ